MRVVLAALAVAEASAVVHLVEGCEGREPALVAAGVAALAAEAPPVVVVPTVVVVWLKWMMRDLTSQKRKLMWTPLRQRSSKFHNLTLTRTLRRANQHFHFPGHQVLQGKHRGRCDAS